MRIYSISNVIQNYNSTSFKAAKPTNTLVSKIANKTIFPTAIGACMVSSLLGCAPTKNLYKTDDIQYQKEFVTNNKNYTMTYINSDSILGENAVTEIYLSPKNKKSSSVRLESLTKYVSDNGYNVVATVLNPKSDKTDIVELPQEIGDELLDLYEGKTEFFLIPGINTYSEIYTNYFE